MISFLQIGCKGTTFCAHSQIKCTKTAKMCTLRLFCAMKYFLYLLLLYQIAQDVARQFLGDGTGSCTRSILGNTSRRRGSRLRLLASNLIADVGAKDSGKCRGDSRYDGFQYLRHHARLLLLFLLGLACSFGFFGRSGLFRIAPRRAFDEIISDRTGESAPKKERNRKE